MSFLRRLKQEPGVEEEESQEEEPVEMEEFSVRESGLSRNSGYSVQIRN